MMFGRYIFWNFDKNHTPFQALLPSSHTFGSPAEESCIPTGTRADA